MFKRSFGPERPVDSDKSVESARYWSDHNVTLHRVFATADESLAYLHWRNDQYLGYAELLPVEGFDGQVILDFGCGPGNDLVGFTVYSKPARLIAMDVSQPSLDEARARLALHGGTAEFVQLDDGETCVPLDDETVDYVHCSGVLMVVPDPLSALREFHRVLKPSGRARFMVYNRDSIWVHLYVAYDLMMNTPTYQGLSLNEAFLRSTDGETCPINRCWTVDEFLTLARDAGFRGRHLGNAISLHEMCVLPHRYEAMQSRDFPAAHRKFLMELTFDRFGRPLTGGVVAGIDGCYELSK